MSALILALGSNLDGSWGLPVRTLDRAICEIDRKVGHVVRTSRKYLTAPVGSVRQRTYVNSVVLVESRLPAARVLKLLHEIEYDAGRRRLDSSRWSTRVLDIDIIDYGGRVNRWSPPKSGARPGRAVTILTIPHPHAHLRPFVLVPVLDVCPNWWHPVLKQPGKCLLSHLRPYPKLRALD